MLLLFTLKLFWDNILSKSIEGRRTRIKSAMGNQSQSCFNYRCIFFPDVIPLSEEKSIDVHSVNFLEIDRHYENLIWSDKNHEHGIEQISPCTRCLCFSCIKKNERNEATKNFKDNLRFLCAEYLIRLVRFRLPFKIRLLKPQSASRQ